MLTEVAGERSDWQMAPDSGAIRDAEPVMKRKWFLPTTPISAALILLSGAALSGPIQKSNSGTEKYAEVSINTNNKSECPSKIKLYVVGMKSVPTSQNKSYSWLQNAKQVSTQNSSIKHVVADLPGAPQYYYVLDDPGVRDGFGEPLIIAIIAGGAMIHYARSDQYRVVYDLAEECLFEDGLNIIKQVDQKASVLIQGDN
ncbi:hypothetical protein H0176_21985 [Methylorubrum populi]|uniref:Uncharacterized protein n=1 Tax=Methylorubrum rhodesianum TaxID=29427 RepID=A0ABU9Z588_9HYPH|nr:hypothetical protein [Methylorubrum rhodesianum]MBK3402681.1 hypothetical protein [Methylorubrum rhodesianum]MBY0142922.1 hypothetical protein [Methylorubrum populi]